MNRAWLLAIVLLLSILSGPGTATTPAMAQRDTRTTAPPADPEEGVIGWKNGYWYNESIAVDQSDGLNATERNVFLSRSMARVELLRGLEFTQNVTIQPIARDELSGVATNMTFDNDTTFGAVGWF